MTKIRKIFATIVFLATLLDSSQAFGDMIRTIQDPAPKSFYEIVLILAFMIVFASTIGTYLQKIISFLKK